MEIPSLGTIMEETTYIVSQETLLTEVVSQLIPPIEVVLQLTLPGTSIRSWTSHGISCKQTTKNPNDVEASGYGSTTMFPGYIPLRTDESPHVKINKNAKYSLVNPSITKGVHVKT